MKKFILGYGKKPELKFDICMATPDFRFYIVSIGEKYGLCKRDKMIVIPLEYEEPEFIKFEGGYVIVLKNTDNSILFSSQCGKILEGCFQKIEIFINNLKNADYYDNIIGANYVKVKNAGGKSGIIDFKGKEIVPCRFDEIYDNASYFYGNCRRHRSEDELDNKQPATHFIVKKKTENGYVYGLYDINGNLCLEPKYGSIYPIQRLNLFKADANLYSGDKKCFIVTMADRFIEFYDNRFCILDDDIYSMLDYDGNEIFSSHYPMKHYHRNPLIIQTKDEDGFPVLVDENGNITYND